MCVYKREMRYDYVKYGMGIEKFMFSMCDGSSTYQFSPGLFPPLRLNILWNISASVIVITYECVCSVRYLAVRHFRTYTFCPTAHLLKWYYESGGKSFFYV